MQIVARILFSRWFSSGDCRLWTSSHQGDGRQEYIFHCRLWNSSEFSSRRPSGDAGYGAGYIPPQCFIKETIIRLHVFRILIKDTEFWYTNERPGSDHVIWGSMRGLEKNCMGRGYFFWTQFILVSRLNYTLFSCWTFLVQYKQHDQVITIPTFSLNTKKYLLCIILIF